MSIAKKRKMKENRVFNEEWEILYYVVPVKDKMMCLICDNMLATMKKYNAQQHYATHKDHKYASLEGLLRKSALMNMKTKKKQQQQLFTAATRHNSVITEATYKVAYILGKKGKPYSDMEIIKECILEVVACLDPDKIDKYREVPLSRRTITDRQSELASNINQQLQEICLKEDSFYSIALDESTDITDSAQLLIFIRIVTADFECYEELLSLATLVGKTRGIDVLTAFKEKCLQAKLNLANLVSVCTDGAPSMRGKHAGFVALLQKEVPNPDSLIYFHCILHQQNLCAKSTVLNNTLSEVIGIVNYIRANASRHRQFRHILQLDEETFSVDLPYHCKVRWLSQGQVLVKILELRKQITSFFVEQNEHCELSKKDFCRNVAFLCDLMEKQNELNISLQGKTKSIYDMWSKIQTFRKKLTFLSNLFLRPLISVEHFPKLAKICDEEDMTNVLRNCDIKEYKGVLDCLIEEYNDRFKDFEQHDTTLQLVFQPHLLDILKAPDYLQMELIDVSEDQIFKSLFNDKKNPIEIWKNAVDYPKLREHARRILSCFGTTYCCESTFSHLTQIKSCLRSQLTNTHLEDQLRLKTTRLEPNIKLLSSNKQSQKSH